MIEAVLAFSGMKTRINVHFRARNDSDPWILHVAVCVRVCAAVVGRGGGFIVLHTGGLPVRVIFLGPGRTMLRKFLDLFTVLPKHEP